MSVNWEKSGHMQELAWAIESTGFLKTLRNKSSGSYVDFKPIVDKVVENGVIIIDKDASILNRWCNGRARFRSTAALHDYIRNMLLAALGIRYWRFSNTQYNKIRRALDRAGVNCSPNTGNTAGRLPKGDTNAYRIMRWTNSTKFYVP
jgi:hypothetical protein